MSFVIIIGEMSVAFKDLDAVNDSLRFSANEELTTGVPLENDPRNAHVGADTLRVWETTPGKLQWKWPEFKFDMEQLPEEFRGPYGRVKARLEKDFGEEYALRIIFTMLTAEHLHRAWNMTPLTHNVLKQLKKAFNLRITWELGVLRLKFRIEEGLYELHRKVPYDYDSEFQDKFLRLVNCLLEGRSTLEPA